MPKAGNSADEYEDAYYLPSLDWHPKGRRYRFAIADGATETSFSHLWAKLLVRAYGQGKFDHGLDRLQLGKLQMRWANQIGSKDLPWYAEEKLSQGAFSSLLGLQFIHKGANQVYEALGIGDSCFFQLRGQRLLKAFPIVRSADFDNRPLLLSSTPAGIELPTEAIKYASGEWEDDDEFFLMTDALACWFLKWDEANKQPWRSLRTQEFSDREIQEPRETFLDLIDELRISGHLRNDDVTLVYVRPFDIIAADMCG